MSLSTLANVAQVVSILPLVGGAIALWMHRPHIKEIHRLLEERHKEPSYRVPSR